MLAQSRLPGPRSCWLVSCVGLMLLASCSQDALPGSAVTTAFITAASTTAVPTTAVPTTAVPTTAVPTTAASTTAVPDSGGVVSPAGVASAYDNSFTVSLPAGWLVIPQRPIEHDDFIATFQLDEFAEQTMAVVAQQPTIFVLWAARFNTGRPFNDNLNVIRRSPIVASNADVIAQLRTNLETANFVIDSIVEVDHADYRMVEVRGSIDLGNGVVSNMFQRLIMLDESAFEVTVSLGNPLATDATEQALAILESFRPAA